MLCSYALLRTQVTSVKLDTCLFNTQLANQAIRLITFVCEEYATGYVVLRKNAVELVDV